MEAIHVTFEGFTSTYRIPFILSGIGLASPVPPYSSIVGLISCCLGRQLEKNETLIGFEYTATGSGRDMETSRRLKLEKGKLKRNPENAVPVREFHVNPRLDLYLSNTSLKEYFEEPRGVPCLGRSQDICWIKKKIEIIQLQRVEKGRIGQTLIPFPCESCGGRLLRAADYYENDNPGYAREPSEMKLYQVIPKSETGVEIEYDSLYRIVGDSREEHVIYLHKLT